MRVYLWATIIAVVSFLAMPQVASAITNSGMYSGATQVTSFNFPTSAVSSNAQVRTPDYTVRITSGSVPTLSTWRTLVSINTAFTGPGGSLPSSAFSVQGNAQGTGWAALTAEQTTQTNLARTTLTSAAFRIRFISPTTAYKQGNYSGSFRIRAGQYNVISQNTQNSDVIVNATVHILGRIAILDIRNVTGDVVDASSPNTAVTSFDFPTQTSNGGRVRSDTFRVRANANTQWNLMVSITQPFTESNTPSQTKPVTSFGWQSSLVSPVTSFTGLNVSSTIASNIAVGTTAQSPNFIFVSNPATNVEPGTYQGEITFTIMAN